MSFLLGFVLGIFAFIGYGGWRALRSDGWDNSNFFNWLRLLGHVFIHPEDFRYMYYLSDDEYDFYQRSFQTQPDRVFDYLDGDEYKDHFPGSRNVKS